MKIKLPVLTFPWIAKGCACKRISEKTESAFVNIYLKKTILLVIPRIWHNTKPLYCHLLSHHKSMSKIHNMNIGLFVVMDPESIFSVK